MNEALNRHGGSAFPGMVRDDAGRDFIVPGMTLRDYFAGQVIAGMYAHGAALTSRNTMAELAYVQADAMLEEREK